jgi:polysaccharide export outer membrane protein
MGLFIRRIYWTRLLLVLITGFVFFETALASETVESPQKGVESKRAEYLIGSEDILEISVWNNAELSKVVVVRPDGMISLPLIGDVKAAGLTPNALRGTITERLKEYQETVVVSVIVQEVNSYRIFILGGVINPGTYLLKRKTSLLQAIALAGGFNQFASKNKIVVIRQRTDDSGREEKIRVRFDDIVDVKDESDINLILRPGDTIFVP